MRSKTPSVGILPLQGWEEFNYRYMPGRASSWCEIDMEFLERRLVPDMAGIRTVMQDKIEMVAIDERLVVWIVPSDQSPNDQHHFFVRMDDVNQVVVLAKPSSTTPPIAIAGKEAVEDMMEALDENLDDASEFWVSMANTYIDVLENQKESKLKDWLRSMGVEESAIPDQFKALCEAEFQEEGFRSFLMICCRATGADGLIEAHMLSRRILAERARIEALRKSWEQDREQDRERERERDQRRLLRDVEAAKLDAKGARELAERNRKEVVSLRQQIAQNDTASGKPQDALKRLHEGFASLFTHFGHTA